MFSIIVFICIVGACAFGGWIIYTKSREKKYTRDAYAFRCLAATVSLVTLLSVALASKESLVDHILTLVSMVTGNPKPASDPVPIVNNFLLAGVIVFAIFLIFRSYEKWEGLTSDDEVERKRLHRPTSVVALGFDEGLRLLRRDPDRAIHPQTKQIKGEIFSPPQPQIVWNEYARELFELWYGKCRFDLNDEVTWDPSMRCWRGLDKLSRDAIFLFCVQEQVGQGLANDIEMYITKIVNSCNYKAFVARRGNCGLPDVSSFNIRIKYLSLDYLLDNLVDFSDYYNDIKHRVEGARFPETDKSIKDIYAPSSLESLKGDNVSDDLGGYLSDWAKKAPGYQLAILGEYGQGKSTGALMFVYEAIDSNLAISGHRVPILFELRGKSPSNLLPHELLAAWAQKYKLQADALMKLLIAGRLILIFEGFDEMANVASVEARLSHFRSLWQFGFPESKIIFTGRPNLFFADRELEIVFKASDGYGAASCEVFRLAPFSIEKIERSLRWVDRATREEILDVAKSNVQILDIVARPSLLYIVAVLWSELRALLYSGKVLSAQVIDKFISHSYHRQAAKETQLGYMTLTTTERHYFHEGLAVYMASKGATNQIVGDEMEAVIGRLYRAYPDDTHVLSEIVIESDCTPLKRRLNDPETAIETIATDVRTHGILVDDPSRPRTFRFAHKSFYELLYAKSYACALLNVEPAFYKSVRVALGENMGEISQSGQIIRFFSEVLIDKFFDRNTGIDHIARPLALLLFFDIGVKSKIAEKFGFLYFSFNLKIKYSNNKYIRLFSNAFTNGLVLASIGVFIGSAKVVVSSKAEIISVAVSVLAVIILLSGASILILKEGFDIGARWMGRSVTQGTEKTAALWAAVLLAVDEARGGDLGQKEIAYCIGERAPAKLLEQAQSLLNKP